MQGCALGNKFETNVIVQEEDKFTVTNMGVACTHGAEAESGRATRHLNTYHIVTH